MADQQQNPPPWVLPQGITPLEIVCGDCANPLWCRTSGKCQGCHYPTEAERAAIEQTRLEHAFLSYQEEMSKHGITELHEDAPSGQLAFSGTLAQWVAFFEALEAEAYSDG